MSYYVRIFCTSADSIRYQEIAEFIVDGAYFEQAPSFQPSLMILEGQEQDWRSLELILQQARPAVRFEVNAGNDLHREEIEEFIELVTEKDGANRAEEIILHLLGCKQVIAAELDTNQASDEVWEMLDNLSAYIARKCVGIIYIDEQGFFDQDLQSISTLPF